MRFISLVDDFSEQNKLKPPRQRGRGWLACAIAALTIPLTGCVTTEIFSGVGAVGSVATAYFQYLQKEKGEPQIVTPDIEDYSSGVQALAADELDSLGPPCGRQEVADGCSAIHRMIIDYGDLRRRIRAAKDD